MGMIFLNGKEYAGSGSEWHEYSTEEKVVGKWIDGKPIYEKTIIVNGNLTSGSWQALSTGLSNVETVVELKGGCLRSWSGVTTYISLQYYEDSSVNGVIRFVYGTSPVIHYRFQPSNNTFSNLHIVIQYTKTTD